MSTYRVFKKLRNDEKCPNQSRQVEADNVEINEAGDLLFFSQQLKMVNDRWLGPNLVSAFAAGIWEDFEMIS